MDWSKVIGVEAQALAVLLPPLTIAAVGWLLSLLRAHIQNAAVRAEVSRLVAWAQQTIPATSERYAQVATMLEQRFPALHARDIEVLIESEVHALKSAGAPPAVVPALPASTAVG